MLKPSQNDCRIIANIFVLIVLYQTICIWIDTLVECIVISPINKKLALVSIMNWCRIGEKPLFESMRSSSRGLDELFQLVVSVLS